MKIMSRIESNDLKKLITFILTFIFISAILMTSLVTKKYNLEAGDIAKFDIKAPKEVTDTLKTKEKQQQKEESVPLQYNKNLEIKKETLEQIDSLFFRANKLLESALDESHKIQDIRENTQINLSEEEIKILVSLDDKQLKSLQENLKVIMNKVLDMDIREDNEEDIKKPRMQLL